MIYELIRTVLGKYRRTLQSDRRHLLEQFTLVQVAVAALGIERPHIEILDTIPRVQIVMAAP